jgi:hypothetical protein
MIGTLIGLGLAAIGFFFSNVPLIAIGFAIAILLTVFEQRRGEHATKTPVIQAALVETKARHILLPHEPRGEPQPEPIGDVLSDVAKYETREQKIISSPILDKIFIGLPVRMGKIFKK